MASIDRVRRIFTDPAVENATMPASAESIARDIFSSILRNLEQHGFSTSHLRLHDFRWLLPSREATQQQMDIFLALRNSPLTVPNGDLACILQLELSTVSSPFTPLGTRFYLRSFELTHHQIKKVIEYMTEEDTLLSEAVEWESALNIHHNQGQSCTFTIRYVGKVSGPGRPIDRHIKDLATDKRPSDVILEFVAARKLLDQDRADGITRSKKAQCVEIPRRVNNLRASDRDMRDFMNNFRWVGNELRREWSRLHHCPEFVDYRPISAEDNQMTTKRR